MSIECVLLCLGDLLIIMAQIIVATQMVYEQKFVMRYNVPALQAVGWEGMPVRGQILLDLDFNVRQWFFLVFVF